MASTIGSRLPGRLGQDALRDVGASAVKLWRQSGISSDQSAALEKTQYRIAPLGGNKLGAARGDTIWIDPASPAKVDLLTLLLHEQGHILGLPDDPAADAGDVMNPRLGPSDRRFPRFGQAVGAVPGAMQGIAFAEYDHEWELSPEDLSTDTEFGYAVAISGNTAVIGAPHSGRASIFELHDQEWTKTADLRGAGGSGSRFGCAVASAWKSSGSTFSKTSSFAKNEPSIFGIFIFHFRQFLRYRAQLLRRRRVANLAVCD